MKRLLLLIAEQDYFLSHRLTLAKTAIAAGYTVGIATRCQQSSEALAKSGITVFPLKYFSRTTLNPFLQLLSIIELYQIYKKFQPTVVHHVAIKPVVLGSLVAFVCKIPKIINALGGLGYLFTEENSHKKKYFVKFKKIGLRRLITRLFSVIFSHSKQILILQNPDDHKTLQALGCLHHAHVHIIPGSVDSQRFKPSPFTTTPPIVISCISRMLWNKGIGELVLAATWLKQKDPTIEVRLYGMPDPENPASISLSTLLEWHQAGIIVWKKHCTHVAKAYADSHIAVLPSYREGLPKTLLEAASCGRPIVTTDVPGCREVVIHNETGLLVPAQNAEALAEALWQLCQDPMLREKLGSQGRIRIETYFSDAVIHPSILKLYLP